jgi:predicted  nucleic acid-binding Zn-ribbon protein
MACMEHECADCGHVWFDNEPPAASPCPKCGSHDVSHFFDEEPY